MIWLLVPLTAVCMGYIARHVFALGSALVASVTPPPFPPLTELHDPVVVDFAALHATRRLQILKPAA